ncbi:MAG: hypothetical protein ABWX96_20205, partial [Propionibacteriaceae bacterium]
MTDVAGSITVQAWVESPFQLLGALEAHASGRLGGRLVVLPRKGVEPLVTAVAEVSRLGLPDGVTIHLPTGAPRRGGDDLAVLRLKYRVRGWNGNRQDPVQDARW